jgi:isoquinoline 1-oxidoreductase subunit alpha
MTIEFELNGAAQSFDGDPQMPLLWYLRDHAHLTGTKFGCGIGVCGACTVHVNSTARRSCITPMATVAAQKLTTIEGIGAPDRLHPVQQAWIEEDVAQCGYCQVGQIMATIDLLQRNPNPSDAEIAALGNLCRCGTYPRIRLAVRRAAKAMRGARQ